MVFKAIHTAAARAAELERGAASSRMTGACAVAGLGVRSRGWFVSLGVLDGRREKGWRGLVLPGDENCSHSHSGCSR